MNKTIASIIDNELDSLYKTTNIIVWNDLNKMFFEEYSRYQSSEVNKLSFEGSFIELRYKILLVDKNLSKKWLIYCDEQDTKGFMREFQYFGATYAVSMKDILERYYRVDFSGFEITNLTEQLRVAKNLWDSLPEDTIRNLTYESLTDIVLTKGFGYIDLNKEYSVLKYICETDRYEAILNETGTKKNFISLLKNEYGIDISPFENAHDAVDAIVELLFQCEVVHKNRRKDIKPLSRELTNPGKLINCIQLLEIWAKHEEYKGKFIEFSKTISDKHLLKVITETGFDEILNLEYWYGVEQLLYKKLEVQVFTPLDAKGLSVNGIVLSHIYNINKDSFSKEISLADALSGWNLECNIDLNSLSQQLTDLRTFADVRRRYYFSKTGTFKKWNILYNIFSALELLFKFESELSSISSTVDNLIEQYQTSDWWKIDMLYRKIQEDYSENDDFTTKLLKVVNGKYNYEFLKILNEKFSSLIDGKYDYDFDVGLQIDFWSRYVSKNEMPSAVVIVDALRFEMGKELYEMLGDTYSKKLSPLVSAAPSITEIGMASLLPGQARLEVGVVGDKLDIKQSDPEFTINNKEQRIAYFYDKAGNTGTVYNINEFIDKPLDIIKYETKNKKRLVIFSSEIDHAGHIEDSSIQLFPLLLTKIASVIRKIINSGISRVVVVSDHGFILTNGLEEWKKIEVPKELKGVIKKRRYIVSNNKVESNYIVKSSHSLNHEGNLYFNFPRGLQVFPYIGGTLFSHGGLSLQELLIPVIEIENSVDVEIEPTVPGEQISLLELEYAGQSKTTLKAASVEQSVTGKMKEYINQNESLNKKQRKILSLFTEYASLTDSDIQEICERDGIKFKSQTVPEFMSEFIDTLKAEGNNWINFRMVGITVREYYLK